MGRTRTSFPAFRQLLALSALVLAAALPLQAWAVDTDGDGVDDSVDAFPNNPEATIDTDHDGEPNSINWTFAPNLGVFSLNSPFLFGSSGFPPVKNPVWTAPASGSIALSAVLDVCSRYFLSDVKTYIWLPVNVPVGSNGTITFSRSVTGTGDYVFYDNSTTLQRVHGSAVAGTVSYVLAPGDHILKWSLELGCPGMVGESGSFSLSDLSAQGVKASVLLADADDDNDGTADISDAFPLNAAASVDVDNDALPDRWNSGSGCATNAATCNGLTLDGDADPDGDGVLNAADNCVTTANASQQDTDADGAGDACDSDDDNDGVVDTSDKFPLNAAASVDPDNDGQPEQWNQPNPFACAVDAPVCNGLTLDPNLPQSITVTQPAPAIAAYGSSFNVAATASSGLPVSIVASGGCSISGNSVMMTSGTTACVLTYSQAGDSNYAAAANVKSSTTATKLSQSITVTQAAPASAAYGSSFSVAATSSSGLSVSIAASGGCAIAGSTVTMNSAVSDCQLNYTQAGNSIYNAAPNVASSTAVLDNDGDGVPYASDNCPTVANADQANFDGDVQGDACDDDDNNNGVLDTEDLCPQAYPCAALTDEYLDSTFGEAGRVHTAATTGALVFNSSVQQPSGKLVMAGTVESSADNLDGVLVRYNSDGSLDGSFGVGGKVVVNLSSANDAFYSVALQTDGKLVVAGSVCNWADGNACLDENSALLRFSADGVLDSSFGIGGLVSLDTASQAYVEQLRSVAVQSDGSIVAVGYTCNGYDGVNCYNWDTLLVRLNSDGALSALTVLPMGAQNDQLFGLALQTDDKVVAVGRMCVSGLCDDYNSLVMRFDADGSLDGGFATGGVAIFDTGSQAWTEQLNSVAVQTDGNIVAAGYTCVSGGPAMCLDTDILTMRLNNSGSLDGSFAAGGISTQSFGVVQEVAQSVAVRNDGIWLAGTAGERLALLHLQANGNPDTQFSGDGKHTSFAMMYNSGLSLLQQSDGKLVLVGSARNIGSDEGIVLRYAVVIDSDGDGVYDSDDAFPQDGSETLDTDHDGIGNNADMDDDGDGVPDYIDADPLNAANATERQLILNGPYSGNAIQEQVQRP